MIDLRPDLVQLFLDPVAGADGRAARHHAVVELARAEGLVGSAFEDPDGSGLLSVLLAVDADGRAVRLRDGTLGPGRALAEIEADLTARLAALRAERAGAAPTPAHEPVPSADAPVRRVAVLERPAVVDDALAIEVAGILGTDVLLVPADARLLAVATDGEAMPVWPRRLRPVLVLEEVGADLTLEAYLPDAGAGQRGVRDRLAAHALPSWSWTWSAHEATLFVDGERLAALAAGVRTEVRELQGQADPQVLADALALDATGARAWAALLDRTSAASAAEVVAALGLPAAVPGLLAGTAPAEEAEEAPGARSAAYAGAVRGMAATVLARPEGDSLTARVRRWDWDRPLLSVLWILGELALAGVAGWFAATSGHALDATPWRIGLGVVAALLAVEAAGSTVTLVAVRRRLSRSAAQ
ncbi:hypothetical protein RDV89_07280 [Nocardioides zeae]|uniref:ABC transporter permease n=1 Tax=Nocardioides imazamoxiresistens TaxID=3231893 RepID=A0ABU3PUJ8_9ACTN|nr:hypothetical protein [Nocardioides zeae]MDT9592864.1 hypothetical protein [Nocardioides zeae]